MRSRRSRQVALAEILGVGVEDLFVEAFVVGDDAGSAEAVLGGFAGCGGHGGELGGVAEEVDGGFGHAVDVADFEEAAGAVVVDELGDAADAGGDGGDGAGHGFEGGEAEGLHFGGEEHEVGQGEELVDVVLLAEEVDAGVDAELEGELLGGGAVGAVADEHEAGGHVGGDAGEDLDDVGDALDGAEVGKVDEELFFGFGGGRGAGEAGAHGRDEIGVSAVKVAVDEVVDDFDGAGDAEGVDRSLAQVIGNSCDAVGLLDAEAGDGEVGAVEADEGDVGAVEGGDEGEVAAAGRWAASSIWRAR